ncbi:MAG: ribonuclease Z [Bacteroidales bacterium]|nr:ribonuclease Z [Bacteroidales bacterium]
MIDFKLTVLGCGSAVPNQNANPSSQLLTYRNKQFLIDCGEGTQMRMIKYKLRHRKLDHVLISHLHGDHFFGLVGLLSTYHLSGRQSVINIFAPRKLEALIGHHFQLTGTILSFPLLFHALEDYKGAFLYEDDELFVRSFPLKHSTPAWGFLLKEKEKKRRIDKAFITAHKPEVEEIKRILNGADFISNDGILLKNKTITHDPLPPRAYAYCSDTAYAPSIVKVIDRVNLLYHEATFDNSMQDKAQQRKHSTAKQAAMIAKQAGAGKLLIGHFSNSINDVGVLLKEAVEVFEHTEICREGETYPVAPTN